MDQVDPIRILHIDDEPEFADMAATYLEREDDRFTIETAANAREGQARLDEDDFDCVVCDYDLPGLNGIEFLETVREESPDLPFILFTGKGSEEVASDAISAGVTDYLQKTRGTEQYTILANRITNAVSARRSTQEADQTRQRLERIVETVPSCVVRLDRDGEFVFANERAMEVLGLERSDVTDRTYNDPEWNIMDLDGNPVPDEDLPFRRIRDSGEPLYGYRHTIEWPDGIRKILMVNGTPLFDGEGAVESVLFSLSDVTEHVEREEHLQRSTARLQALFENSPDMINVHDAAGNIIDPNPRLCEETGYDEDELTGMKVWDLDQSIDHEEARTLWADMEIGERRELEGVFQRRDGSTFPVEVHIRRLDLVGEDRFLVISRDVSEREERERMLRQLQYRAEELIRAPTREDIADIAVATARDVLDLPLSGVHLVDDRGETLEPIAVTDEVHEHLGQAPTYDRTNPSRVTDSNNWEIFERGETVVIGDAHEDDRVTTSETPSRSGIIHPLGDHGLFITSSPEPHAFDDTDLALTEILATIVTAALDRTERETTLRDQKRRLEAETERLEEFASIVSHDLRNPLSVAEGRVELAREECDSEHLAATARAHERMRSLIDDLLALARDGAPVEEVEPVVLAEIAEACWRNVETGEATLVTETDHTIRADRSRLQQLLENLVRNAVEHGGDGVTVRIGDLDEGDGFYVADDGPGVPPNVRERIFESGYSTSQAGTGFGLAIVKEIAEAHGWTIGVTDSETGGARFEIAGVTLVER